MRNVLQVMLFGGFVFLVGAGSASAREFADIYTDCGLGAMIAPKNSATAAATNVSWDSGTTAISSNITSPDTCNGGQDRTAAMIHQSYGPIERDLASGKGEYLSALIKLSNVDPAVLREKFAKAVAEPGYASKTQYEKSEMLYNLIYKS